MSPYDNMAPDPRLQAAYGYCLERARGHYENFPVASRLLPRRLRRPIRVIYTFARNADDMADEGDDTVEVRLQRLQQYEIELERITADTPTDEPVFIALKDVIRNHHLPIELFHDLLAAFRMDVTIKRYARFEDILNYCQHSANPVGRLLLHLYGLATPVNLQRSDAICTSLQLINFYQDLQQDLDENDRLYLPLDELRQFGVADRQLREQDIDDRLIALMQFQYQRAYQLMLQGTPLGNDLPGRIGLEMRMIILGGLTILRKLRASPRAIFQRPRLTKTDVLGMVWHSLLKHLPT